MSTAVAEKIPTQMYIEGAWCDALVGQDAGCDQSGGRVGGGGGGVWIGGRSPARDRCGEPGVSCLAGLVGVRPRQGPEEDGRADARARRDDRANAHAWSRASRSPRPRRRSCTRPIRSSGLPRKASASTAGSFRRPTSPSVITRSSIPVGRRVHDHALEFPGRAAQPQDRRGDGRGLHGREPAGRPDSADLDPDVRVPG